MTNISERQRAKKLRNVFIYKKHVILQKSWHLALRDIFIYKKQHTLYYVIFYEFLKLEFLYKNHVTLRYMTFIYI